MLWCVGLCGLRKAYPYVPGETHLFKHASTHKACPSNSPHDLGALHYTGRRQQRQQHLPAAALPPENAGGAFGKFAEATGFTAGDFAAN